MNIYRRKFLTLIWTIITMAFGAIVAYVIAYSFVPKYSWLVGLAAVALALYVIYSEDTTVKIDDEKIQYYSGRKLKGEYFFKDINNLSYRATASSGSYDFTLIINEEYLDCSGLGRAQCEEMYQDIKSRINVEPLKLN